MKNMRIFSVVILLGLLLIPTRVFGQDYRDGVWAGQSRRGPYTVELELVVEEGKTREINFVSLPDWETETVKAEIRRQVLARQSAELEAVAGATISSELIAEAVGQALAKARSVPAPASTLPAPAASRVILRTTQGEIEIELFPEFAPLACENFLGLAKKGYYDGTIFHRVIPNFMIQGGDPTGTGRGGESIWGKSFADEILPPEIRFDRAGLLAMANRGPNTNGSQFFITVAPTPWLDGKHTIFGRVVGGYEVAEAISLVPTGPANRPTQKQEIIGILIP